MRRRPGQIVVLARRLGASPRRAVWIENGREVTLDPHGRAVPSAKTRKSDDPVLRFRRLLQDKVQPLGDYSQAVLFPNEGDQERFTLFCARLGI